MQKFIITGITSGLGFELALRALSENHRVIGILRHLDKFKESDNYKRLIEMGNIEFFEWDLKEVFSPELKRSFLKVLHQHEEIDCILHFAGYLEGGSWEDFDPQDYQSQIQVNALNIHSLTRLCFPFLSQGARVYAAGSVAGHFNYPLMGPYCASKHLLRSMFESWYYEGAYRGIQFCHLSLGPVKTPFWNKSREANNEFSKDYTEPIQAISIMSQQIESRGLTVDYVVNKIWKSLSAKSLPQDWVIVKNYFLDYLLMKLLPRSIQHYFIRKLLKLPSKIP